MACPVGGLDDPSTGRSIVNALIMDTETTGLEPTAKVVDLGVILQSIKHGTAIAMYSSLVEQASNAAEHVNGIPPAALVEGAPEASVWERTAPWVTRADCIIAHNASFDRQFVPDGWDQGKPWLCSMTDIVWPRHSSSKSLVAIALAHGLGIATAHRALTDCQMISRLLERCHELGFDVGDMLRMAARPKALYRALVSYNQKDQARASGFSWNPTSKQWTRRIAIEDANAFPFRVELVA